MADAAVASQAGGASDGSEDESDGANAPDVDANGNVEGLVASDSQVEREIRAAEEEEAREAAREAADRNKRRRLQSNGNRRVVSSEDGASGGAAGPEDTGAGPAAAAGAAGGAAGAGGSRAPGWGVGTAPRSQPPAGAGAGQAGAGSGPSRLPLQQLQQNLLQAQQNVRQASEIQSPAPSVSRGSTRQQPQSQQPQQQQQRALVPPPVKESKARGKDSPSMHFALCHVDGCPRIGERWSGRYPGLKIVQTCHWCDKNVCIDSDGGGPLNPAGVRAHAVATYVNFTSDGGGRGRFLLVLCDNKHCNAQRDYDKLVKIVQKAAAHGCAEREKAPTAASDPARRPDGVVTSFPQEIRTIVPKRPGAPWGEIVMRGKIDDQRLSLELRKQITQRDRTGRERIASACETERDKYDKRRDDLVDSIMRCCLTGALAARWEDLYGAPLPSFPSHAKVVPQLVPSAS